MELTAPDTNTMSVRTGTPPWQKYRGHKTTAIFVAYSVVGVTYSMIGPSLVSLEIVLGTTTKYVAAGLTGGAFGYLAGAALCGFIYGRLNKEFIFLINLLIGGSSFIMVGYSFNLAMYIGGLVIYGSCMAFIDTGAQSYILKIWENNRFRAAVMQALHSMWSLGSTLGPFILQPFLAQIHIDKDYDQNTSTPFIYLGVINTTNSLVEFPEEDYDPTEEVSSFRTGFLIAAGVAYLGAVIFLVAYCLAGPSCLETHRKRINDSSTSKDINQSVLGKRFRIRLMVIVGFYYFFFNYIEGVPGNFLAPFVIKELGWENDHGAIITATYWGAHGIGRVLGIPVAMCFKSHHMVFADLVLIIIGFGMMFFISYHIVVIWIATVTFGLGAGTLFASALLYVEKYIEVTGSASAVVIATASLGGMTSPLLTGYLMESYTYTSFIYICLASTILEFILFIIMVVYGNKCGVIRQQAGSLTGKQEPESPIEMTPLN